MFRFPVEFCQIKCPFFSHHCLCAERTHSAVPLRRKIIHDLNYMFGYFSIIKLTGGSGNGVFQLCLTNSRIVGFDIVQYLPLSTNLHSHKPLPSYKSSHSKF